jgi:glycosyltransferase involved in cell wall biosynthesis
MRDIRNTGGLQYVSISPMSKPLCHMTLASDYRGGERQEEILRREMAGRGWPQRLVVRRGNPLAERCRDVIGLEIVEVASNPFAAGLAARGSALVHAHEARCVYSGAIASLVFRIPYIFTRRVPNPQRRSTLRDISYHWASFAIAVSEAAAAPIREQYPDVEVSVVPDAHAGLRADSANVASIRERFDGKLIIGHVGALDDAHKGQMTIIEAARVAQREHPDWQFVLCGSGKDEERFRVAAEGLTNVEFTGFVENIGDYYGSFDVFVFPSRKEALGSAMLAAMHFGLPVIASKVDGIPEFLEDGVNGRLVEPGNPRQLLEGIEAMVSDRDRTASMRAANTEKVMSLDAAAMADRYEVFYRDILAECPLCA